MFNWFKKKESTYKVGTICTLRGFANNEVKILDIKDGWIKYIFVSSNPFLKPDERFNEAWRAANAYECLPMKEFTQRYNPK